MAKAAMAAPLPKVRPCPAACPGPPRAAAQPPPSPPTEHIDRGGKKEIDARILMVGEYYLFDPIKGSLEGYLLDRRTRTYHAIEPDPQGFLSCHQLGLRLGVVKQGTIGSCGGHRDPGPGQAPEGGW